MHTHALPLLALAGLLLTGCGDRQEIHAGADDRTASPGDNAGRPDDRVAPVIGVARSETHGLHLVDAGGRALYALREDPKGGSVCYGGCERVWPPLLSPAGTAQVAAGTGLEPQQLARFQRNDGAMQVLFGGRALYYYASDRPGDTLGHGVEDNFGHWMLVAPDGSTIHTPGGPPTEAPGADATPRPGG